LRILEINELDKSYGLVHAVNHLSLTVSEGQVYGILGPNGSGKTTTLAMVMGIVRPDGGTYRWFGGDGPSIPNLSIGAMIESPNFYPYLNLVQNLTIPCRIKGVDPADIERVLRLSGLWLRHKSRFATLSLGMKQRLALAGALLGDPRVLVMDEPTNGLDPEGIAEVRDLIRKVASTGKTILLASHLLDEVEKVCSHVAILKGGQLIADGPVGQLIHGSELLVVAAENLDELKLYLDQYEHLESCYRFSDWFELTLKDQGSPADLNRYLVSHGMILTRLEVKKQRLEDQFLELVKKSNS